jgi:hypothetical protein
MQENFVKVVLPVLGISDDPAKEASRARLESCIKDVGRCYQLGSRFLDVTADSHHLQVYVTRNWLSHGSGRVAVPECKRAVKSLVGILEFFGPFFHSLAADADAATASVQVQRHIQCMESSLTALHADLSVPFHANLLFMRALDQLRVAACSSAMIRTKDNKQFSDLFSRNSEVSEILEAIPKGNQDLALYCELVHRGRNYFFHGANIHETFLLLLCTCAVAPLLRCMLLSPSAHSPKGHFSDAAGSDSTKMSAPSSFTGIHSSVCEQADLCEANAMHLMHRMGFFISNVLLQEIRASHLEMSVFCCIHDSWQISLLLTLA